jgi:hypothetical protein
MARSMRWAQACQSTRTAGGGWSDGVLRYTRASGSPLRPPRTQRAEKVAAERVAIGERRVQLPRGRRRPRTP